jgi:pimeloyl-ACP methyl ester carboxylesterase
VFNPGIGWSGFEANRSDSFCQVRQTNPVPEQPGLRSAVMGYQFAAFAEAGFRCIGIDRRGHGRSDQSKGGYDNDTFADDIAALIERLEFTGLTIIGHSMVAGDDNPMGVTVRR